MDYEKKIDIPFGAHDSELKGWEYTIPEGMEAIIKDGKVLVREKESEDEKIRRQLINVCNDWLNGDYSAKPCLNDIKWLKNLLEKQKEQKPAEWSEKDEQWLEAIIKDYENSLTKDKDHAAVIKIEIDFLKSIPERFNLQPKQEWSEEDERNFYWISTTIQERHLTPEYAQQVHKILSWLKSLRPSWKPSEEHLSALLAIFNDPDNIGSQTCQLALTDLYEQLKSIQ